MCLGRAKKRNGVLRFALSEPLFYLAPFHHRLRSVQRPSLAVYYCHYCGMHHSFVFVLLFLLALATSLFPACAEKKCANTVVSANRTNHSFVVVIFFSHSSLVADCRDHMWAIIVRAGSRASSESKQHHHQQRSILCKNEGGVAKKKKRSAHPHISHV